MSWREDERNDQGELPSEEAMRLAQEQREREEAERQLWREKMNAVNEMKTALDVLYRKMRWKTETYSRPMDYTEEKFAEEVEISAWQIQGAGETLRDLMPELYWPKGTPVSISGAVFYKTERLQAFRLDLEALLQSVDDVLLDTVEVEEEDEDDD